MRTALSAIVGIASILATGCEYAFSDAATRVRYALVRAEGALQASDQTTMELTVNPDHAPEGCAADAGYRLVLSPYTGGKQVPVGDIDVYCGDGHRYYTGLGSESLILSRQLSVQKGSNRTAQITLRKVSGRVEIVDLK